MARQKLLPIIMMSIFMFGPGAAGSFAQSNPAYIQFSPSAVKGALYKPDSGAAPHVAILVMHRTSNVMGSLACTEPAKRGFMVLCMNPRFDNNEALVRWETIALDVSPASTFSASNRGSPKYCCWAAAAADRQ